MQFDKYMVDSGTRAAEEALKSGDMTRAEIMLSDFIDALKNGSDAKIDHRISACVGLANTLGSAAQGLIQSGVVKTSQRVPSGEDLVHDSMTDYGRFIGGLSTIIAIHKEVFAHKPKVEYTLKEGTRPIKVPGFRTTG